MILQTLYQDGCSVANFGLELVPLVPSLRVFFLQHLEIDAAKYVNRLHFEKVKIHVCGARLLIRQGSLLCESAAEPVHAISAIAFSSSSSVWAEEFELLGFRGLPRVPSSFPRSFFLRIGSISSIASFRFSLNFICLSVADFLALRLFSVTLISSFFLLQFLSIVACHHIGITLTLQVNDVSLKRCYFLL